MKSYRVAHRFWTVCSGRLTQTYRRVCLLTVRVLASASSEAQSRGRGVNSTATASTCDNSVGQWLGRLNRFERKNRRRHHDRLAGTDVGGGGRAGSLWPNRRSQEPPVSNDLALDITTAAYGQTGKVDARFTRFASRSDCRRGATSTAEKENTPFLSAGESPVLVLDDSGRDRRGFTDPRPDDDCKRDRPRAYPLIDITRCGPDQFERVARLAAANSL